MKNYKQYFKSRLAKAITIISTFLFFTIGVAGIAQAIPFEFSGTSLNGDTAAIETIGGLLNIQETPSVFSLDNPPTDYTSDYTIDYTFLIGAETFTGSGIMRIRDTAGLFDQQFSSFNTSVSNGVSTYTWEATDGAFFDMDGAAYPDWSTDSLAYSVLPWRVEFYNSFFMFGFNESFPHPYSFTNLAATRVPEASSLALMLLAIVGLGLVKRKR